MKNKKDIKKQRLYHRNKAKTDQSTIMSRYKIRILTTLYSVTQKHTKVALHYHNTKGNYTLAYVIMHQNRKYYHFGINISFHDAYLSSVRCNAINGGAAPRMIIYRFAPDRNDSFTIIKNDWMEDRYRAQHRRYYTNAMG